MVLKIRGDSDKILVTTQNILERVSMSKSIAQDLKHRQAMVLYAIKTNNNADAGRKYHENREYVRFWRKKYNGTIDSLREESKAPKKPVNKQKEEQVKLIEEGLKEIVKSKICNKGIRYI